MPLPTPAARNSPVVVSDHLPAAFDSGLSSMPSVRPWSAIRPRTRRPHFSASSTVWLAHKIAASGLFAISQHGNKIEAYVLLLDPGGAIIIKRAISPRATASSRDIIKL